MKLNDNSGQTEGLEQEAEKIRTERTGFLSLGNIVFGCHLFIAGVLAFYYHLSGFSFAISGLFLPRVVSIKHANCIVSTVIIVFAAIYVDASAFPASLLVPFVCYVGLTAIYTIFTPE